MATATSKVEPNEIGWMFVPQFYTFVNKEPSRLHCFYTKKSTLIHGTEGDECPPRYGQQEIHDKIMSLDFQDCKVYVSNVDSQSSAEGGIIVQVLGEMSNKNGPWRKFAQTFFLAEQPTGYFVLNDIFRYLKDSDDESGHEEDDADVPTPVDLGPPVSPPLPSPSPAARATEFGSMDQRHVNVILQQPVYAPPPPQQQPATTVQYQQPTSNGPVVANGYHRHPAESVLSSDRSLSPPPVVQAAQPAQTQPAPVIDIPEGQPVEIEQPKAEEPAKADPAPVAAAVKEESPAPPAQNRAASNKRSNSPPKPAVKEESPAIKEEQASAPVQTIPQASTSQAPPVAQSQPQQNQKPAVKTWANLAAVAPKQGNTVTDARGVIVAAPPAQAASSSSVNSPQPPHAQPPVQPVAAAAPPNSKPSSSYPRFDPDKLTIPNCYVRSIPPGIDRKGLEKAIKAEYGAVRDLEMAPDRGAAFLEFVTVDSAKKAVKASMPSAYGGEDGFTATIAGKTITVFIEPKRPKSEKAGAAQGFKERRPIANSKPSSSYPSTTASSVAGDEGLNGAREQGHKKQTSSMGVSGKKGQASPQQQQHTSPRSASQSSKGPRA